MNKQMLICTQNMCSEILVREKSTEDKTLNFIEVHPSAPQLVYVDVDVDMQPTALSAYHNIQQSMSSDDCRKTCIFGCHSVSELVSES